jgi:hypothetical protein
MERNEKEGALVSKYEFRGVRRGSIPSYNQGVIQITKGVEAS